MTRADRRRNKKAIDKAIAHHDAHGCRSCGDQVYWGSVTVSADSMHYCAACAAANRVTAIAKLVSISDHPGQNADRAFFAANPDKDHYVRRAYPSEGREAIVKPVTTSEMLGRDLPSSVFIRLCVLCRPHGRGPNRPRPPLSLSRHPRRPR